MTGAREWRQAREAVQACRRAATCNGRSASGMRGHSALGTRVLSVVWVPRIGARGIGPAMAVAMDVRTQSGLGESHQITVTERS